MSPRLPFVSGPFVLAAAIAGLVCSLVWTPANARAAGDPIDLVLYQRLLESHTRSVGGLVGVAVDYQELQKDAEWKGLVKQVESAKPSGLGREERLAYWINAYNILTIDLILKHYPIESIKDIGSFFSPVWNVEVATIEGKSVTLGEIEHDILRPMGEPRIHAAIVCASSSCPPLSRQPFRPEHLDSDLSRAMQAWLQNPKKGVRIDRTKDRVTLSKIFDWFEEDFDAKGGALKVIAPALSVEDARWIRENGSDASLRYFSYDWSLNDLAR